MFTMVAEFLDQTGTRIEVLPADRIWLKENQTVPKNWKIWLANYERGSWKGLWIHSTVPIQGEEHIPETNQLGIDLPNTQSTTFLVGKLYVHVISSAISRIIRKQDIVGQGRLLFPRLWPIRRSPLAWPPFRPITDEEADTPPLDWTKTQSALGGSLPAVTSPYMVAYKYNVATGKLDRVGTQTFIAMFGDGS